MKKKIPGVYKITNTVTGNFYIGSSVDVYHRWANHKCPSSWNRHQKSKMYQDMQTYGVDKFKFEIIVSIMPECLMGVEQDCIELMNPTYNQMNAYGVDIEKEKITKKAYYSRLCCYNGETLTLHALDTRFRRAGIPHSTLEAKKYLI